MNIMKTDENIENNNLNAQSKKNEKPKPIKNKFHSAIIVCLVSASIKIFIALAMFAILEDKSYQHEEVGIIIGLIINLAIAIIYLVFTIKLFRDSEINKKLIIPTAIIAIIFGGIIGLVGGILLLIRMDRNNNSNNPPKNENNNQQPINPNNN